MTATQTPAAEATSTLTPPALGALWPEEQAIYAGIVARPDGKAWHLLIPTTPTLQRMAWGEYGKKVEGASSNFDGHANTLAMAAAGSELAQKIRELPGDCYLPSRAEWQAMLEALKPDQLEEGWYWTSTQYSAYYAFGTDFPHGYQYDLSKGYEGRVRPVRRLLLQSFNGFVPA